MERLFATVARQSLISRVGDDGLGRFLVEALAREGCDVSHVSTDPSRLTGAVVLGIKDKDTFPLIFMRENCADMAIAEADVEESFIAQSRALLTTVRALFTPQNGANLAAAEIGSLVTFDKVYDVIRDVIADLGLPLNRLEQRRRRVEELFRDDQASRDDQAPGGTA